MKHFQSILLAVTAVMAVASCQSYKKLAYLQDLSTDETYIVQDRPESKISVGDKLSITVTCSNPTLAAPFNVANGFAKPTPDVDLSEGTINWNAEENKGYLVDKNGDIDFPVLGKINVAGTTLVELKNEIERLLKEKPYIQDPLVFVEFLNFQVTFLGQGPNGNYTFKSGNVNLLEALAQAGAISGNTAQIDELWVIRTTGGQRKLYTVNLKSKSLYDSPVFYLQQNDLIYAKPKNNITNTETTNRMTAWTTVLSSVSTLTTMWLIYLTYFKR
ncbi:MAG: polysaccharide biosynthesis/export family protein [Bacteroidaceae bacterium]|nr:polysaccharide biosynthesis/export family protein [Bacteroidaceae bacterium]